MRLACMRAENVGENVVLRRCLYFREGRIRLNSFLIVDGAKYALIFHIIGNHSTDRNFNVLIGCCSD